MRYTTRSGSRIFLLDLAAAWFRNVTRFGEQYNRTGAAGKVLTQNLI